LRRLVFDCNLTDAGFGNTLKYFSPTILTYGIFLGNNQFKGTLDQEFLPGLELFDKLEILDLSYNRIEIIGGGQFKNNTGLRHLNLMYNQIVEIRSNGFKFNDVPGRGYLQILMRENQLDDYKIDPNHGFDKIPTLAISFDLNNFTTISSPVFEPIVQADGYKAVYFESNGIVCDEKVKWLKDGKDLYETRVNGADCINDPGYSVFNSTKIP
jgi:hypothetical protein